jgi:hypothetical protein
MTLWMPKKKPLYAPMLGTFGGGSARGYGRGGKKGPLALGTITQHYNAGSASGIQNIDIGGVTHSLNYDTFDSKGWVEVMFHADVADGHHLRSQFYYQSGSTYKMSSENTLNSNTELDYTQGYAQVMLGTSFNATDMVVTSKSSKTLAQISPATGQNQNSALPLYTANDLGGSQVSTGKSYLLDFFLGNGSGVSGFYNSGTYQTSTKHFHMYWDKAGFQFNIVLFNRDGSPETDHWHIASSQNQSSSTYFANIGYRGASGSSWLSRNVGAWASTGASGISSQYQISNSNVLSVWLTDM